MESAGKTVKTWVVSSNRQPEKPGVYKVYNRRNGKTTETEMVWNGTYWMTTNGGKAVEVVQWLEEAPVAGASADGTALASADAGTMTEAERVSAVARYEARIQLYKEQIGTGYIGIGKTLNEAKAAGVVPHGQWEAWVTEVTGLSPRNAQRCMQAAREIKDGSALARLEMEKAILLLGSGMDEETREEIAERAAEEGATVKALREEIRQAKAAREASEAESAEAIKALKLQVVRESGAAAEIREALKKAQAERAEIEQQMTAAINEYKTQMDNAVGDAYRRGLTDKAEGLRKDLERELKGKIDFIASQRNQAEERIRDLTEELEKVRQEGGAKWDEGFRAGQSQSDALLASRDQILEEQDKAIDGLREQIAQREGTIQELREKLEQADGLGREELEKLRRNQGDLLAAAEDAEKRAADAEAELEQLRAGQKADAEPAVMVLSRALAAFFGECELMPYYPESLRGHRQPILESIAGLETWCERMRGALDAAVPAEGAVL